MLLSTLDIALRAGTVALLLMLAASLVGNLGNVVAGRLAAAFALGSAAHAASYSIGPTLPVSAWHAPLIALSTGNVVVFWLFTHALFDDGFRLRARHGLVWAAVAAFSFVNCLWIAPGGHTRLSIIAINLVALGFIGLAVAQTVRSWSADLVEGRRRIRVFIVAAAALYGGINAVLQIFMSGSGTTEIANTVNAAVLAGIVAVISYALMRVDGGELFPATEEAEPPAHVRPIVAEDAADQKLVDALMRLMADERIYRHDNVTIGTLAAETQNTRVQVAAADQPAARLPQFQCLPQQPPDRGSQGRAGRSGSGRGPRHHHCDGRRLPVARPLQPRLQGHHRGDADRISPAEGECGLTSSLIPLWWHL